ncbi:hypothetical protein N8257_01475 [Ulvibacter sp.]|nr:hypothetical protein [Ulvibacter sp.]
MNKTDSKKKLKYLGIRHVFVRFEITFNSLHKKVVLHSEPADIDLIEPQMQQLNVP